MKHSSSDVSPKAGSGDSRGLLTILALLSLVMVGALLLTRDGSEWRDIIAVGTVGSIAVTFLAFCLGAPLSWLLPAALTISVLVPPVAYSVVLPGGVGELLSYFSPSFFFVAAWLIRGRNGNPDAVPGVRPGRLAVSLFACWSIVTLVFTENFVKSVSWITFFVVLFVAVNYARIGLDDCRSIRRTWFTLGSVVSLYAIFERSIGANPIYDGLYNRVVGGPSEQIQHWADYRSQASFGHPIFAAMFFSATSVYAFLFFLSDRSEKRVLLVGAICAAGTFATGTRGAMVALAVGLVLGVATGISRVYLSRLLIFVLGLGGLAAVLFGLRSGKGLVELVTARFESREADVSANSRVSLISDSLTLAQEHGWLGAGAGTSRSVFAATGSLIPIESSPLQLLVSTGVVGLGLLSIGLLAVGIALWRDHNGSEVGLLACCLVALSTFNGFEDVPTTGVWLALSLVLCYGAVDASRRASSGGVPGADREVQPLAGRRLPTASRVL